MTLTTHPSAKRSWRAVLKANVSKYFPSIAKPSLPDWLERWLQLPQSRSAKSGQYRLSETPYLREILDVLGDDEHERIVIKKSARLGVTEAVINGFLAYTVATDPGPIMIVWPTKDDAQEWSKEVLPELFATTEPLQGLLSDAAKASDNTILHKAFPGGHLHAVGSNSARTLRRRNIRYLGIDELDACDAYSRGREGSVVKRAEQRTTTYDNRKIVLTGSPELLETSRITKEFERSDQRHYYVPCPECGHYQELVLANLQWDKDEAKPEHTRARHLFHTAHFVCAKNGCVMEHRHKRAMVTAGKFVAHNPGHRVAGFFLNQFVSLFPNASWAQIAEQYYDALKDPEEMIAFVNTILGEAYEDRSGAPKEGALAKRRESWAAEVPRGAGVLTAGVDVQDDRLEVSIHGWGVGQESWIVAHHRIYGDPDERDVWQRLDTILSRPYAHEGGAHLYVRWTFVDCNDEPERVHAYTTPRNGRNVYSVRGVNDLRGRKTAMLKRSKAEKGSHRFFNLNVDRCKDMLFRRLKITTPGPGMIHIPLGQRDGLDDEYLLQFSNEKRIERRDRFGRMHRHYAERGPREAIDCFDYAYGGLLALGDAVINELPRLVAGINDRGRELRAIGASGGTVPVPVALSPAPAGLRGPRLHSKRDW
jgi:phage terminase large subunit GpA-like protein